MRHKLGLTVVEVLLASVIFALVAAAVYRVFCAAVKADERAAGSLRLTTNLLSTVDQMEKDFHGATAYRFDREEMFQGHALGITLVTVRQGELVLVSYGLDEKNWLVRQQTSLQEFLKTAATGPKRELLDIKEMEFSFGYRSSDKKSEVIWKDQWVADLLPFVLRWTAEVWSTPQHRHTVHLQRTFLIPHGELGI